MGHVAEITQKNIATVCDDCYSDITMISLASRSEGTCSICGNKL